MLALLMKGFGHGFEPNLTHQSLKSASLKSLQPERPGKLHGKASGKREGLRKKALSKDPDGRLGMDAEMRLNHAGHVLRAGSFPGVGLAHGGQRLQEQLTSWILLSPRKGEDLQPFLHARGIAGSYVAPAQSQHSSWVLLSYENTLHGLT